MTMFLSKLNLAGAVALAVVLVALSGGVAYQVVAGGPAPATRAERAPVKADGAQMIVAERPYGTFTRQVFLGETLDADHIAADYAAGVLTLTIPVHEAAKPRSIEVTSSDERQAVAS